MSIKASDTLLYSVSRFDPEALIAKLDGPDDKDRLFLRQLESWAKVAGVDDAALAAMWLIETANGTSTRWNNDFNPGGIGIPADSTVQPFKIGDSDEAARIFVQCVYALVKRKAHPSVPIPANAKDWFTRVWLPKVTSSWFPTILTVNDLNRHYVEADGESQATWAWNPDHVTTLVARGNAFMPGLPDQDEFTLPVEPGGPQMAITFGRVPYPDVFESHFSTSNPYVKSGAPAIPDAVFWHRMIGTWAGTDSWGHSGNFATAYGVSVKATDGAGGKIYEWIDPDSGLYGESSGPAVSPYGDGLAFVNEVGVSNVNRRSKAIEISGNYDTPLDEDAIDSVVEITAYWADQKHIPWNEFPIVPGEDRSYVVWHQEITGPDYKECPGRVVITATPAMIDRVALRMKQFQETVAPVPTTPPPPPKPTGPTYPKGMSPQLAKRRFGGFKETFDGKEYDFRFDERGPVSQAWLAMINAQIGPNDTYRKARIGPLESVIRRGADQRYWDYAFTGMGTVTIDTETGKVV